MASRKKKDYTKLLSITECGICGVELRDPRRIECGHIFCLKCLGKHMINTPFCFTCKRPMNPKKGKVENYPVAEEIVHLLHSLQKVASYGHIADEEDKTDDDDNDEDEVQYDEVDDRNNQLPKQESNDEVCDIHGYKLVSVCLTCDDELICSKCSIHSSHEKTAILEHTKQLERLLGEQTDKLYKRAKIDEEAEGKLQDMIEKEIEQKESIKDEIEEVTEDLFAQIHMKKEELLQPVETKADENVKVLTERQEQIKDRLSEFRHIRQKLEKLSNDGTTDFCKKAKRLVKQTNIALQQENIPLPTYQHVSFTKNNNIRDDLSKLQLGYMTEDEYEMPEDSSDFSGFSQPSPSITPPPRPKPKINIGAEDKNKGGVNQYINEDEDPPRLPPRRPLFRNDLPDATEDLYCSFDSTYYDISFPKGKESQILSTGLKPVPSPPAARARPPMPPPDETAPAAAAAAAAMTLPPPPPLSPFSGSFRKSVSVSIATSNRSTPQKLIHRVFLPFRPSGFTVVHGSLGIYYAFVTDDSNVKLFRQNGAFDRVISDLTKPFDIACQQRGKMLTPIYITDEGKGTGDGSIKVYTSEGQFSKVLIRKLRKPRGISVSRVGLVYVCDETNILVLCPDTGKKKRVISKIGKDPLFVLPLYVMVSANGKILVSDVGTRQLKIHHETWKYTDKFQPFDDDEELYVSFCPGMCSEDSSSNYYVVDRERNALYRLDSGGRSQKMELPDKPKGHDGIPTAVAFDADTGNIIVF
ncbi:tripartite motif-containing protein 2-like [Argopecten irradians]|uniref:tripartite motif-containing protein 2-like n=1 Tax=Argopecten irradians TaxID=31199 RepID=UPI00370FAE8F